MFRRYTSREQADTPAARRAVKLRPVLSKYVLADQLLAEHVALRYDALAAHERFVPRDAAVEKIELQLAPIHTRGTVEFLGGREGLDAVVAWEFDEHSYFGPPVTRIAIDSRPGAVVGEWLASVLIAAQPEFAPQWDLLLDRAAVSARRALGAIGGGVDSVIQLGSVDVARARFRRTALPVGLHLEPMTLDHVDPVMSLYERAFTDQPEYCWFGADRRFLASQRERLIETLADPAHLEVVITADDAIVGHASGSVDHEHPFWGPTAGMSLCFAPEARGRGLARAVYSYLLDGMADRGARSFRGGTSQLAVMRFGIEMGRELEAFAMRPMVHFPEAHFSVAVEERFRL